MKMKDVADIHFKAMVEKYHQILSAGWKAFATDHLDGAPEGARQAHVIMLGYAMRGLAIMGYTAQEIQGIWEHVLSDPHTIELMEEAMGIAKETDERKN